MRTKEHTGQKKLPFPLIGNRILKTALAVFICLMIHILRGFEGGVAESCITAIICMQPYVKDSKKSAKNRLIGTCMGGLWGLIYLYLMFVLPDMPYHMVIAYAIMSIGVICSIYSCVVLKIADSASLAAIVFLCVVIKYPEVEAPFIQTIHRILDTTIGVLVGVFINSFSMPTKKREDKVFFLHLDHLAADRYSRIGSRVLIELNRLYDEGAKIVLETQFAPAFLLAQLQMVHINMPVIVMGGAALYDIRENRYLEVQDIPMEHADYLYSVIEALGYCGVIFTLRKNSMMLFHVGEMSDQEKEHYITMRRSPYRNYLDGKYTEEDQILAFRMILEDAEARELEARLNGNLFVAENFHVIKFPRPRHEGEWLFYFYRIGVSIDAMEKRLLTYERKEEGEILKPVRIQPKSALYDPERDAVILLNRIKKQYMIPYFGKRKK